RPAALARASVPLRGDEGVGALRNFVTQLVDHAGRRIDGAVGDPASRAQGAPDDPGNRDGEGREEREQRDGVPGEVAVARLDLLDADEVGVEREELDAPA